MFFNSASWFIIIFASLFIQCWSGISSGLSPVLFSFYFLSFLGTLYLCDFSFCLQHLCSFSCCMLQVHPSTFPVPTHLQNQHEEMTPASKRPSPWIYQPSSCWTEGHFSLKLFLMGLERRLLS